MRVLKLEDVVLEGRRIALRSLVAADARDVFVWVSDPKAVHFMSFLPYRTEEEVRAWLEQSVNCGQWVKGIVWKATGKPIGSIGLSFSEEHGWNLGYILRRDFWGRGIATEAARLVLGFAFDRCGIESVFCQHAIENEASRRVIEKLGFAQEAQGYYQKVDGSRTFRSIRYRLTKEQWGKSCVAL